MTLLIGALLVGCFCLLGLLVFYCASVRENARLRARIARRLGLDEIRLRGDLLASFEIEGTWAGNRMALQSRTRCKKPGPNLEEPISSVVRFDVPLGDVVICKIEETSLVVDAAHDVSRRPTGDPRFDAAYALFVAGDMSPGIQNYRARAEPRALEWVREEVLTEMVELDLRWLRVQAGRCELVFAPATPGQALRMIALGANVGRAALGRPMVELRSGHDEVGRDMDRIQANWKGAVMVGAFTLLGSFFAALTLGLNLPRTAYFRELNEADICEPGTRLLVKNVAQGRGWTDFFYCSSGSQDSVYLHPMSVVAAVLATVLAVAFLNVLIRWMMRR